MNPSPSSEMVKIAVFYDGSYFYKVSNYYAFQHPRRRRLDISGLQSFIQRQVSELLGADERVCKIIDAHYFRGRISARDSQGSQILFNERVFDEILMNEGITTHYLPMRITQGGRMQEKGIDVLLALEAYELAVYKKYDVLVLIACDGDYVPLVRKLGTLGTRVMLLGWDFEFSDEYGNLQSTRTSQDLLEEVTYPIAMHEMIENRLLKNDPTINSLFVPTHPKSAPLRNHPGRPSVRESVEGEVHRSAILVLKDGYGFIDFPPNNVFFHYSQLVNVDFNDLRVGDMVDFVIIDRDGKPNAVNVRKIVGMLER